MHICSFVVAAESHVSEPSADLVFSMMSQIVQGLMRKFWKYGTDIWHGGRGKDSRVHDSSALRMVTSCSKSIGMMECLGYLKMRTPLPLCWVTIG